MQKGTFAFENDLRKRSCKNMRGPAAPKDPVEKRPCLYVVLDKTISGSKDPEGVIRD